MSRKPRLKSYVIFRPECTELEDMFRKICNFILLYIICFYNKAFKLHKKTDQFAFDI